MSTHEWDCACDDCEQTRAAGLEYVEEETDDVACSYGGCNRPAKFALIGLWRNAPITHACERCAPSWAHEAEDGETCGAYRLQILGA